MKIPFSSYHRTLILCHLNNMKLRDILVSMAGVKLLNIVGSTSLFLPMTSLFVFNEAEMNNMLLNEQRWTI